MKRYGKTEYAGDTWYLFQYPGRWVLSRLCGAVTVSWFNDLTMGEFVELLRAHEREIVRLEVSQNG